MKYFLILFSFLFPSLITAQQMISAIDLLASAKEEKSVLLDSRKLQHLQQTSYDIPWIQELEFRTEVNEWDIRQQEYAFRLTPNSRKERKAQNRLHKADIQLTQIQQQQKFAKALTKRYDLLVEHLFTPHLLRAQQKLQVLYQDKINVIKANLDNKKFDLEKLISAEEELYKVELNQLEWKNNEERTQLQLQDWMGPNTFLQIDTQNILSVSQILQSINSDKDSILSDHVQLRESASKMELIDQEYELELAKIKDPVTYIQTKYGGRNRDNFREAFSIGAGFKLPFKGDDKVNLSELQFDRIREENNYQTELMELQLQKRRINLRIRQTANRIQLLKEQRQNSQAKFALEQLKRTEGAAPMTLLRIREILLKKEVEILGLEYQIFRLYVNWLESSGLMTQLPLSNKLSVLGTEF